MPSPFTWDINKPGGSDGLYLGDDQIRADKATLRDVLRTLVPFGSPTLGWRQVQIGNVNWMVHNARYTGTAWERDDVAAAAAALRYNSDGTIDVLTAGAGANPITWVDVWSAKPRLVRVFVDSDYAATLGSPTAVAFNSETFDTSAMHDTATNSSRLVAPVAGKYRVTGQVHIGVDATLSSSRLEIRKQGNTTYARLPLTGSVDIPAHANLSAVVDLAAGEYVELIYHLFGFSLTSAVIWADNTWFAMEYLGA